MLTASERADIEGMLDEIPFDSQSAELLAIARLTGKSYREVANAMMTARHDIRHSGLFSDPDEYGRAPIQRKAPPVNQIVAVA